MPPDLGFSWTACPERWEVWEGGQWEGNMGGQHSPMAHPDEEREGRARLPAPPLPCLL